MWVQVCFKISEPPRAIIQKWFIRFSWPIRKLLVLRPLILRRTHSYQWIVPQIFLQIQARQPHHCAHQAQIDSGSGMSLSWRQVGHCHWCQSMNTWNTNRDLGSRIQDLSGDRGWNICPMENKWKSSFYPWCSHNTATVVFWTTYAPWN